jgi:hypothetical protein
MKRIIVQMKPRVYLISRQQPGLIYAALNPVCSIEGGQRFFTMAVAIKDAAQP